MKDTKMDEIRKMIHKMDISNRIDFAIFCAEKMLPIFENYIPDDNRIRSAIDAAKAYIKEPTSRNKYHLKKSIFLSWSAVHNVEGIVWYRGDNDAPENAAWVAASAATIVLEKGKNIEAVVSCGMITASIDPLTDTIFSYALEKTMKGEK